MSTTEKYDFNWLLPISLVDTPIPFSQFVKPDIDGVADGYYSYNEWTSLPNKKAFYTPSGTHAILGMSVTSIKMLATQFQEYLSAISGDIVWVEGIDTDKWLDEDQTNYLWTITTDRHQPYSYDEFIKVSPLFVGGA